MLQYLVMGLKYLYDDSGIRVIVLDREHPTKIKNMLISDVPYPMSLRYNSIQS